MKHFLANSNEDGRDSTSSDFDTRLFHEYYAYPFYKGITEGGSRAFMAAYNSWNGIPMSIHPCCGLDKVTGSITHLDTRQLLYLFSGFRTLYILTISCTEFYFTPFKSNSRQCPLLYLGV